MVSATIVYFWIYAALPAIVVEGIANHATSSAHLHTARPAPPTSAISNWRRLLERGRDSPSIGQALKAKEPDMSMLRPEMDEVGTSTFGGGRRQVTAVGPEGRSPQGVGYFSSRRRASHDLPPRRAGHDELRDASSPCWRCGQAGVDVPERGGPPRNSSITRARAGRRPAPCRLAGVSLRRFFPLVLPLA